MSCLPVWFYNRTVEITLKSHRQANDTTIPYWKITFICMGYALSYCKIYAVLLCFVHYKIDKVYYYYRGGIEATVN